MPQEPDLQFHLPNHPTVKHFQILSRNNGAQKSKEWILNYKNKKVHFFNLLPELDHLAFKLNTFLFRIARLMKQRIKASGINMLQLDCLPSL